MVESPELRAHPEALSHQSFPVFQSLGGKPKSRLERWLSVFADVRAGEGITALMMTANIFLLLGAYYLLKPVREALILSESGAEINHTPRPPRPCSCSRLFLSTAGSPQK